MSQARNSTLSRSARLQQGGRLAPVSATRLAANDGRYRELRRASLKPDSTRKAARPSPLLRMHAVVVAKRDRETRAAHLAWLAQHVIEHPGDIPGGAVTDMLSCWVPGSLIREALMRAWTDYTDAVRLENDADAQPSLWRMSEPPPANGYQEFITEAGTRSDTALAVLLDGVQPAVAAGT